MSDQIFARINKLLAIQEGRGATEAEATLAAEHVQRLLQQHNLTLAEVEGAGGMTDGAPREKRHTDLRAMYVYQRELMKAVAENFFCLHRVHKARVLYRKWWSSDSRLNPETGETEYYHNQNQHLLVGRALNVTVALQTYTYLIEAMNRACREMYDTRSIDGKRFLEGATSRLTERLAERRREQEAESRSAQEAARGNGTHRELVLSDVYGSEVDMNNDVLNGFPIGTTATKRRETTERAARQEAEHDRLVAEGVNDTEAWYRAYGYEPERAALYAQKYNRRRARSGRGRTRNWTAGDERHHEKINSAAYRAGKIAGDAIGLNSQVGATTRKQIGG